MLKKILEYPKKVCYYCFRKFDKGMRGMKSKYSALDIAKWFLWKNKVEQIENEDEYDDRYEVYEGLSHLKLQKLLYFAQGVNLVVNNKSLFNDKIVAWTHGPVVRSIYDDFKCFGRNDINMELTEQDRKTIENIELDADTSYVLNLVYDNFCIYTAWQLREMTHVPKGPWETTVREKGMDKEISLSAIKDYFDKNIVTDG
ncbi:MAG: SocA family protein [Bacilli bacterium]|nr:SocA family protein [Bacilli bacterium]